MRVTRKSNSKRARFRIDDMKSRNVILIGGLAANPWVSLFSDRLSFEVNYDWNASQGLWRNKLRHKGGDPVSGDNR